MRNMMFKPWLVIAAVCSGVQSTYPHPVVGGEANWPQFRGVGSRGVAEDDHRVKRPEHWSATENVAWKTDIPGLGWSSPIVWGHRVFVTTVVDTGMSEKPRKGLFIGGDRNRPPEEPRQWKVLCLDLESGRIVWERQVHEGPPKNPVHVKNSFASETPVTDGERVYCLFGNVGLFCLDFEGHEIWRQPIPTTETRHHWGTGASPALDGDRLYVQNDNQESSYLQALDKRTGQEIWRVDRDEKTNWSTPLVWQNELRTEIVTTGTKQARSYDLDGKLLWSLSGMSRVTIGTPYAYRGLLYVGSGYVLDFTRPLYAIRPGASGDISLADQQTSNEWIVWCQKSAAPYNPTTLAYEDHLYVLHDQGLLACYEASTGAQLLKQRRIPHGRAFTSSPWAYQGKLFCLNEDGTTFVFQAGGVPELLHSNELAEDDMCLATPAIANDRLLIRTAARIYCIRE